MLLDEKDQLEEPFNEQTLEKKISYKEQHFEGPECILIDKIDLSIKDDLKFFFNWIEEIIIKIKVDTLKIQ